MLHAYYSTFEMFQFDQIYGTHVRGLINKQLVKCTHNGVKRYYMSLILSRVAPEKSRKS